MKNHRRNKMTNEEYEAMATEVSDLAERIYEVLEGKDNRIVYAAMGVLMSSFIDTAAEQVSIKLAAQLLDEHIRRLQVAFELTKQEYTGEGVKH
jgi:hypothetical protein